MRQGNLSIKIFRERLKVDVGGIDMIVNVVKRLASYVPIGDHHRFQPVILRRPANVDNVLAPDGRFVISESNRLATVLEGKQRHIFRRNALRAHLILPRLGNVPVLAEKTPHVAARGAHAEHPAARQKMAQRFFFDGINLQRSRRAVAQAIKLAPAIHANEAKPSLPSMYVAMTRTKVAVHSAARLSFPPTGLVKLFGILEDG